MAIFPWHDTDREVLEVNDAVNAFPSGRIDHLVFGNPDPSIVVANFTRKRLPGVAFHPPIVTARSWRRNHVPFWNRCRKLFSFYRRSLHGRRLTNPAKPTPNRT